MISAFRDIKKLRTTSKFNFYTRVTSYIARLDLENNYLPRGESL